MPRDGIYRAILWVLVLTVVAGAIFAILGATAAHSQVMVRVGAGVALVAGAIYAFFRWLGTRERRRRGASGDEGEGRDEDEGGDGGPAGGP